MNHQEEPWAEGNEVSLERVRRLFVRALFVPPHLREAWIAAQASSPALAGEVLRLIAAYLDDCHDADAELFDMMGFTIEGWHLQEPLARGGSSRVYRGVREGVEGAVKMYPIFESTGLAEMQNRLAAEVAAHRRSTHPGVVRLFDHGLAPATHTATIPRAADSRWAYLVTELVSDGEPLLDGMLGRGLSLPARMRMLVEVAEIVAGVHRDGVLHLDLKPGNILLDVQGRPRLIDFGIAKFASECVVASVDSESQRDRERTVGCHRGSLSTMAPEQFGQCSGYVSYRTDVYALGILGFRMLTGELPYEVGDSVRTAAQAALYVPPVDPIGLVPDIPVAVSREILRAISKSPSERHADAIEFAAAMDEAVCGAKVPRNSDRGAHGDQVRA